jgi:hypothetical protein
MMPPVQTLLRLIAMIAIGLSALASAASAQDVQEIKQIVLTDALVKNYIAAQPDFAAIEPKLQAAGDNPPPELQAEREATAKKHGFKDLAEFEDVAFNISIVMAGINSETGNFVDPAEEYRKDIEELNGDTTVPEAEKKQRLDELNEAIKITPPVKYKENIEIVKAHRDEIEKALQ